MTHSGQKGFGMTKHGRSGHATRSPRFRFLQKLEAQKNDRKDRSRIKDPKQSVERAIPSPQADTNLTNDPWITSGVGTFDPPVSDVIEAVKHLFAVARQIGAVTSLSLFPSIRTLA